MTVICNFGVVFFFMLALFWSLFKLSLIDILKWALILDVRAISDVYFVPILLAILKYHDSWLPNK